MTAPENPREGAGLELVIREVDEETVQYWIGDTMLIEANHDDDGWVGMSRINEALTEMAEIVGITVRGADEGEVFDDE